MAILSDRVTQFLTQQRPVGTVLDPGIVLAQALAATGKYAGYGAITSRTGLTPPPAIAETTDLSDSEWAVIQPLFLLYVEREQAIYLEASRGLGLEVFGRASSEIEADIKAAEAELPKLAFCQPIISV